MYTYNPVMYTVHTELKLDGSSAVAGAAAGAAGQGEREEETEDGADGAHQGIHRVTLYF
jgi:hypothetical protein